MKFFSKWLPLVWFLVTVSFIFTHLTNDFFVFWAYGRQVSISTDNGIDALLSTWDIKGVLYRAYVCHLYNVTALLIDDFSILCQAVYKLIAIIELNLVLLLAVVALPQTYCRRVARSTCFFTLSICFVAVHFSCHLQPEMVALPFLFLSFSLYLRGGFWLLPSALLLVATFYLKSPIPVMGGTIVAAAFLMSSESINQQFKTLGCFVASFMPIFTVVLLLLLYLYPQEITDILDASHYQRTLLSGGGDQALVMSFAHFVYHFIYGLLEYPVLLVACAVGGLLLHRFYKEKKYRSLVFLLLMWFFPSVYIILSNCYFDYHYDLYIFPSILTIMIGLTIESHVIPVTIVKKVTYVACAVYILFLSGMSYNVVRANIDLEMVRKNNIEAGIPFGTIVGTGEIMYLDGGTGSFYYGNRSYLRYLYPLPIQRIHEDGVFAKSETFKETKRRILTFQGEYLSLNEGWFFCYPHSEIKQYIENNYEPDPSVTANTLSYKWNIFALNPTAIGKLTLLRKKTERK